MAQTGYTPISIYYSATASNTPTAGNLVAGELAINTADGKLFYKDSSGVVQVIAGKGGAGVAGGSNAQVQYNSSGSLAGTANFTYNGSQVQISQSVASGNAQNIILENSSTTGTVTSSIAFTSSGIPKASITSAVYGNGYMAFANNDNTEKMRITADGTVILKSGNTSANGVGITFPATQSASSDANCLDDYEEGTFTPTISSGITSPTYARQVGIYTKIGNVVHVQIAIELNGGTKAAAGLRISGLPFTQGTFNGGVGYVIAYANSNVINSTSTNLPTCYGDSGTVAISFYNTTGAAFLGTDCVSSSIRFDITGAFFV